MSGETMGETNTGKRDLRIPVKMYWDQEKILYCYKEVRDFVGFINEDLLFSFDTLFPSASELDRYPFFTYVDDRFELFKRYIDVYHLSALGASICNVLEQHAAGSIPDSPP